MHPTRPAAQPDLPASDGCRAGGALSLCAEAVAQTGPDASSLLIAQRRDQRGD